jgi:hypothetical protein
MPTGAQTSKAAPFTLDLIAGVRRVGEEIAVVADYSPDNPSVV